MRGMACLSEKFIIIRPQCIEIPRDINNANQRGNAHTGMAVPLSAKRRSCPLKSRTGKTTD